MGENDTLDEWAAWLLHRRDGDDPEQRQKDQELLLPLRQRVLDNAQIVPGEIVLDVGAGDGLIAFGALDRVGVEGRVIVSDVSDDLLSHTRSLATELVSRAGCRSSGRRRRTCPRSPTRPWMS